MHATSNPENDFKESLRECVCRQWETFPYYKKLCEKKGLHLEDLKKAIDNEEYYILPGVASMAFKKSRGLTDELNDLSGMGIFQVSSSTSGDPSYVYTHADEFETIRSNYQECFGIKGVSKAIAFSPTVRILENLSKKAAWMGKQSYARMQFALEGGQRHYSELEFSLDIHTMKSVVSMVFQNKPTFNRLTQEDLIESLARSEMKKELLVLGGVVLLFTPYLRQMKAGQFNFNDRIHIVFSGGGYSGRKGSIRGDKISKADLARNISAVFGMDERYLATNFKDIYGFTESPAIHEGYWNRDVEDFMFTPTPESRVYIVDPETEKPLRQGKGLFKVIAPCRNGKPSAANISLVQYDMARIFGVKPNYQVTRFSHISRFQTAGEEGCALKADAIANG